MWPKQGKPGLCGHGPELAASCKLPCSLDGPHPRTSRGGLVNIPPGTQGWPTEASPSPREGLSTDYFTWKEPPHPTAQGERAWRHRSRGLFLPPHCARALPVTSKQPLPKTELKNHTDREDSRTGLQSQLYDLTELLSLSEPLFPSWLNGIVMILILLSLVWGLKDRRMLNNRLPTSQPPLKADVQAYLRVLTRA